jgi:ADP-dependent NAD(P)H-hydrate dehydratase / NAD(P)H-hydrate epimerase
VTDYLRRLYTAAEMRAAEEAYPGYPETIPELMERAGTHVAETVAARFPAARRITIVCGAGSNGGDGRVAARRLAEGREVRVVDVKPEDEPKELGDPELVVDAVFGTGFSGAPRPGAAALIEAMNALGRPIVAVDVPSGVDASTGEVAGAAIRAQLSVTFHAPKVGLHVAPGRFHSGDVVVADIGLTDVPTRHELVDEGIVRIVPPKQESDNKYTAGAVLVVGGSRGLTGAACLAAEAAFRADAGYVAVAAPASSIPVLEQRLLEVVKRPLPEDWEGRVAADAFEALIAAAERMRAVALGPGLGRSDATTSVVRRLLTELEVPVVVDADALSELQPFERDAPTVLTPHEGELARLLGETSGWVNAHRLEALGRAVERFGCIVLLEGADTLIGAPGEHILVVSRNAPALAVAGTGDVLTGITAAFLAKGIEPRLAAAAAAAAHRRAARLTGKSRGLVAGDVVAALPQALHAPV